jgi:hypothetical protein
VFVPFSCFTLFALVNVDAGSFESDRAGPLCQYVTRLTQLVYLYVDDNQFQDSIDQVSQCLPLPLVQVLSLSNNKLASFDGMTIDFTYFPNLVYLDVNFNQIQGSLAFTGDYNFKSFVLMARGVVFDCPRQVAPPSIVVATELCRPPWKSWLVYIVSFMGTVCVLSVIVYAFSCHTRHYFLRNVSLLTWLVAVFALVNDLYYCFIMIFTILSTLPNCSAFNQRSIFLYFVTYKVPIETMHEKFLLC